MPTIQSDEASINYSRDGQGPGVLLIQGVGVIGTGWQLQTDALKAIPNARYVEFDDAGHGLPIQHADRINALLRDHFMAS